MVRYVHCQARTDSLGAKRATRKLTWRHTHRPNARGLDMRRDGRRALRGRWAGAEYLGADRDREREREREQAGEQGHERIAVVRVRVVDRAPVAGHAATGGSVLSSSERHMARPWAEDRTSR